MQLAQLGHGRHITAVQQAWGRIAASHAAVEAHADLDTLLPADARFPRIHSRLTDGRHHTRTSSRLYRRWAAPLLLDSRVV